MNEISEWFSNNERYELIDTSLVESDKEAAQSSDNAEIPADTVPVVTCTKVLTICMKH